MPAVKSLGFLAFVRAKLNIVLIYLRLLQNLEASGAEGFENMLLNRTIFVPTV
jgi:hypothetical protein